MASVNKEKLKRLNQWQNGEKPGPWEILVYPTNRCNLKCKICWQRWAESTFGEVNKKSELSDERLLRLVDEAADLGVCNWSIVGGGEPMLRGDLVIRMCERIRARGMNGGIYSNGTLFTRENLSRLVEIGWELVSFSVDGPTREINDDIRSAGSFDRATENMRNLAELRREKNCAWPITCMNTVLTSTNYDKLEEVARFAHEMGCSYSNATMLIAQGDLASRFVMSPEQFAELPRHIHAAQHLAKSLGLNVDYDNVLVSEKIRQEQAKHPKKWGIAGDGRFTDAQCFEGWLTMTVTAENGLVGPCCGAFEESMESIQDHSLKEIWLGPYFERLRRQLPQRKGLPPYCAACGSHLIIKNENCRQEMLSPTPDWDRVPRMQKAFYLASRFRRNVRQKGLKETLRRAREWAALHLR